MKGAVHILLLSVASLCSAADLLLTNQVVTMGGNYTYDRVVLVNSVINVPKFNGNYAQTGILQIYAQSLSLDVTSRIDARGAGFQTKLCSDGVPAPYGGAGGCSVIDSGGGGGHLGAGGAGTIDCDLAANNGHCKFPEEFEQTCHGAPVAGGGSCNSYTNCRTGKGDNLTPGLGFIHSVYDTQKGMGPSGGDKGCRDTDGFTAVAVGGFGGGRITLIVTGAMDIKGKVTAAGYRGCGVENDSGGGGAGGTILLVGDEINVYNSTTRIEAVGGRGGDSQPKKPDETECDGTQTGGICDDCGGGGGGGLIYVLANKGNYRSNAGAFNVSGAFGGSCIGCENEAKGLDGWVQFGHDGELCNGVDDTYDGQIDEGLPILPCGIPSCKNGAIQTCPNGPTSPTQTSPTQTTPVTQTASSSSVITGTVSSMNSLSQTYTVTASSSVVVTGTVLVAESSADVAIPLMSLVIGLATMF